MSQLDSSISCVSVSFPGYAFEFIVQEGTPFGHSSGVLQVLVVRNVEASSPNRSSCSLHATQVVEM